MKVACIVPPLHFPVNEIVHGYQPPLGLLAIAGPLVDAGFDVRLIDADAGHLSPLDVVAQLGQTGVDVVLIGHSGSMAANPAALDLLRQIKVTLTAVTTVYGGVYASYACQEILEAEAYVDFVVAGEGEETALALLTELQLGRCDFESVTGLVWRKGGCTVVNKPRLPIADLDRFRVAWELVDWRLYTGGHLGGRSATVQFSRGCPNRCTYCGQWKFWRQWRHRSVPLFVDELQRLHERYDVRTFWLADENMGCDQGLLQQLFQALGERKMEIALFCALCVEDVVRDAERLDLYRRAGVVCVMMGAESFDDGVLGRIGKSNPVGTTRRAVTLLRRHGILSVVNVIYGLRRETWATLAAAHLHLRHLSPDFVNALHLTPLGWTEDGLRVDVSCVVQRDQRLWNFRLPVLQPEHFSPKALAALIKVSDLLFSMRPIWLLSLLFSRDRVVRCIIRDVALRMVRVYLFEWRELLTASFSPSGELCQDGQRMSALLPEGPAHQAQAPNI